ncbi:MAG TPA: GH92 family glycosyl hydrolase [Flavobacteriales bacterium]|nr:GH92 family glycosyl hydrolase [Flavobacteriales bacterium]
MLSAGVVNAQPIDYARNLVNPFVGTGGHGHTFPGACVPNGLVQLSPDTRPDETMDWDGCGGYHYSDSVIYGFSHTHLSGTGVADLCDVLITPVAGSGGMAFDGTATRSRFSHSSEEASAGYYKVDLLGPPTSAADGASIEAARPTRIEGSMIRAELTATPRVGVHRYLFPKGQAARIILNLSHRDKLLGFDIRKVSDTEVVGERRSSSWAKDQRLFFCIRFSSPIEKEEVLPSILVGRGAGYDFGALEQPLIVKVGISAVSIDGARANLETEVPHWDFDLVRKQAEDSWNAKLSKIQVQGGTREQQRIFYTALYHCYVAPYIFNDVDGKYRGMDGEVHHADHNVYTVFSLWDTFRALHPLMTILEPDMTSDWIKTFLLHYQQGGRLPVWELWGNETDCMIGYHSASVIADAYTKGIRGFDADLALEAMIASAMRDEPGLNAYRDRGYISSEDQSESVSKTLEYAYDDWCIAQFANSLMERPNRTAEQNARYSGTRSEFMARSRNWRNLLDPTTGFFRARRNGGMAGSFDPYEVNFNFTEANAWQYSHFAPHQFQLLSAERKSYGIDPVALLDSLFAARTRTSGRDQADITGLIGQYAHGNEPSHHMAYLYTDLGKSERTRDLVHRILTEQYHDTPDGLSGNEDCGQMSAWYVMSALGIYQTSPGEPIYTLGYPLFNWAVVDVAGEDTFNIVVSDSTWAQIDAEANAAKGDEDEPPVIDHGDRWLQEELDQRSPYITHNGIRHGGTIRFDRDRVPEKRITSLREYSWRNAIEPLPVAPIIQAASMAFRDSLRIQLLGHGSARASVVLATSIDTTTFPYAGPFTITSTATVTASVDEACTSTAHFTRIDGERTIQLGGNYANEYSAGGDQALIDGLRGGKDFRTGEWQGYRDQDVLISVDLGSVKKLKRAGISLLQDQGAWIWYPEYVDVAWSMNGRQWSSTVLVPNVDRKADGGMTMELWTTTMSKKARYIKIKAKNAGPCPDWHPGKGGTTWIFADEVLIEAE